MPEFSFDVEFATLGRRYAQRGYGAKKVHVAGGMPTREWSPAMVLSMGYMGTTICGRDILAYRGGGFISEFDDDKLCWSCHRAFKGPKEALFDHEVPSKDA